MEGEVGMKRFLTLLALFIVLLAWTGRQALAHSVALFGHVVVSQQDEVTVRLVDAYGGRVEGQEVEIYATAPGGRPTRPSPMTETAPGTYTGTVSVPDAESYEVTIDMALAGDLHRITHRVRPGEAQAETLVPMAQIDPAWPWTRVVFVAAAVVLAVGTVIAWRRRPAEAGA